MSEKSILVKQMCEQIGSFRVEELDSLFKEAVETEVGKRTVSLDSALKSKLSGFNTQAQEILNGMNQTSEQCRQKMQSFLNLVNERQAQVLEITELKNDDVGRLDWLESTLICSDADDYARWKFFSQLQDVLRTIETKNDEIKSVLCQSLNAFKLDRTNKTRELLVKCVQQARLVLEYGSEWKELKETERLAQENSKLQTNLSSLKDSNVELKNTIGRLQSERSSLQKKVWAFEKKLASSSKELVRMHTTKLKEVGEKTDDGKKGFSPSK